MNEVTPEPRQCKVCGGPLRFDNTVGVCRRNPECRRVRDRRQRAAHPQPERKPCDVCGRPLNRNNESGICGDHNSPACMRERKRRAAQRAGTIAHRIEISAGETFGRWTALEDYSPASNLVPVRCECGNEKRVEGKYLVRGVSTSCGCSRRKPRQNKPPYLLAGTVIGRLTLLQDVTYSTDPAFCRCECGTEKRVNSLGLKHGHTRSCGCLALETRSRLNGFSKHPLYSTWNGMIDRCTLPNHPSWHNYGGRADVRITVCERWRNEPWMFAEDIYREIGPRPEGTDESGRVLYELDRKDNDGGYWCGGCPECIRLRHPFNVQWSTKSEQGLNQRKVSGLTRDVAALSARVAELEALLADCTCRDTLF